MHDLRRKLVQFWRVVVLCALMASSVGNIPSVQARPVMEGELTDLPYVLQVSPPGGFLNTRTLSMRITFGQPMDRERTESAFSIEPPAAHDFKWHDPSNLQIQFTDLLEPGVQYVLTLAGDQSLGEDYRWYYWLDPFVIDVETLDASQVRLKLSTPIDHQKSGQPFRIKPDLEGQWEWKSNQTVVLTASRPIPLAQQFTIDMTGPLYDKFGEISYNGPQLAFTAPPPIRSFGPGEERAVPVDFAPIEITFSQPVDQASAQSAFSVNPPLYGYFSWSRSPGSSFEDTLSFVPNTLLEPGQQYTVSLSPELMNPAGRKLMLSPFQWSFRVEYYSSSSIPQSFGEVGYNVQVVDVDGPRKIQLVGTDPVQFEAYRYDLIDFVKLYSEDFSGGYHLSSIDLPAPEENRLASTWYSTGHIDHIRETIIPSDVPPGLYVLNMRHEGRSYSQLFVILTRNTVVAKVSGNQLFVWVTDINGTAVAEAEVRLYSDRGEKIREGRTDEQGIYRTTVPTGYTPLLVSARVQDRDRRETDVTLTGLGEGWDTWGDEVRFHTDPSRYKVYTYTDRPIYRPGQTVQYKSIVRFDQDVKYSIPAADIPVTVNIRDPKNNLLQSMQVQLSEFGTLSGSFVVASGAVLGDYKIEVALEGESSQQIFKIEDYRKPDYSVTLTPADPAQNDQYVAGENFDLDVDVRYFFGAPVPNAKLSYTYYELYPYYDWWSPSPDEVTYNWYQSPSQAVKNAASTESDGSAQITLRTTRRANEYDYGYLGDWQSSLRTRTFAVEVTADDGSHQPVSAHYIYRVVNASEKLSLETSGYFQQPGTPFTVQASVLDLFDHPVPGRELTLQIRKWNQTTFDFGSVQQTLSLITDQAGQASQELSLEKGYYQLSLKGTDPQGNPIDYERWLGVFTGRDDWYERIRSGVEISAQQDTYRPYQTARFMIESTFSGPALLTFERGSVIHTKQVMLTAPLTLVEAQIIPEDAPNIFVTVNAWEPVGPADSTESEFHYTNTPDSQLRVARTELLVEDDTRALEVSIQTDRAVYAPGDPITVEMEVRDSDGHPVQAELSLALVDEAIFSISNELAPDIFNAFYGPRPLSVHSYDSMSPYRVLFRGDAGGGGGEPLSPGPRTDFPDTAAWYPVLYTDANGHVSIRFHLPDNMTSWRLSAKAVTVDHRVGETRANVETRKDLLLRPILPRVLTTGDQAHLTVLVHNYSDRPRNVSVSIQAEDFELRDPATQSITLPADSTLPVGWNVTPTATTETQLTFTATAEDGSEDAVQLPLLIQPLATAEVQSTSGTFSGLETLDLYLPSNVLPDNSRVTLRLSRTPASSLLDGLEFLTGYPYGCVEQTMSRAMPNAVLGRAASELGFGGEEFLGRIDPLITASIQKLYGFQHVDGGWGWWFDDSSDPYQTAWVMHGLGVIQSAGYSVDPLVMERGTKYLKENLDQMDPRTAAYALYSMSLAGNGDLEATRALADASLRELDPFSQAALALAFYNLGDETRAGAILDVLESAAIHKGSLVYWPQPAQDGEYRRKTMASTVRTTAFVLSALLTVEGQDHPFAEPVADYLVSRRNGYGWGTTNETSFTILALTDYLSAQQAEDGASEFAIELNGAPLASGVLEPGQMSYSLDIALSNLDAGDNKLKLESSGTGPLYYDLITRYTISQSSMEADGRIVVSREYQDPGTKAPLETMTAGQLVRVELTVRLPEAGSFIMIEDHLPGGLEALNEGLNTTSRVSEYYDDGYDYTRYLWQDYGYNSKEVHGDRVVFFITDMNAGVSTFSYLARATTAGTFTALPVEAVAMYDVMLWGRSSDMTLTVESAP